MEEWGGMWLEGGGRSSDGLEGCGLRVGPLSQKPAASSVTEEFCVGLHCLHSLQSLILLVHEA